MATPIDVTVTNGMQDTPAVDIERAPEPSVAYFNFPPFPTPPAGVTITPFKSFKPLGIQVVNDPPPDYVELDGQGIPTVGLRVNHSLTETEQKKKRKLKTVTAPDGTIRRAKWFEEWEHGENIRRMITPIDPSASRVDRLYAAVHDFKSSRSWPSLDTGVPQLWDNFRLFIGTLSSLQPAIGRKRMQQLQAAFPADDDDDDDDDEVTPPTRPREQKVMKVNEEQARAIEEQRPIEPRQSHYTPEQREQRKEYFREAKDARMDFFFNDTEASIKTFFSSYFRDKGLIWSEQRTRDAPILVDFFLKFLLRNRVLPEPEYEKGIRKALLIVHQARKELPHTFVIGRALPDPFSKGCETLWGDMSTNREWLSGEDNKDAQTANADEPDAKRRKVHEEDELKKVVGDTEIEVLTPDVIADLEKEKAKQNASIDTNVNGSENGGWGTSGWGDSNGVPAAGGWGEVGTDPWQDMDSTWELQLLPNPIMSFLGPTVLPLTHTTGVVERSTRRIIAIHPAPDRSKLPKKKSRDGVQFEQVEEEMQGRMAKMVLAPWTSWDSRTYSEIVKPQILRASRGPTITEEQDAMDTDGPEANTTKRHNPFKDELTVLIDPSIAEKLLIGMGLIATWVQIVRQDLSVRDWASAEAAEAKTGKEDTGEIGEPTQFWYMEQLIAILPSYYIE